MPPSLSVAAPQRRLGAVSVPPAWIIVLSGIVIAMHVGKMPPAIPVLQQALGVGLVQCLAMIPGVSRSGATIMGAMALGIDRRTAADFSFFLAIPTLTGATVLQLYKHRDAITANDLQLIAVGALVSFVVALAVVKAFMAVVTRHGFAPFAWYRIIAGAGALVWLYGR